MLWKSSWFKVMWSVVMSMGLLLGGMVPVWANQILNGSFEDTPESCWGLLPPASHWTGYGLSPLKIFGNNTPCPWGGNPPDGVQWLGDSTQYSNKSGGAYQQLIVNASSTGQFRILWNVFKYSDTPPDTSAGYVRVGIDPTGGVDPAGASVVWGASPSSVNGAFIWDTTETGEWPSSSGGFQLGNYLTTPEVVTTGKKITCFVDYEFHWAGFGVAVRFDLAEVTGGFAATAEETSPPEVISVTRTTAAVIDPVTYSYSLLELGDLPGDATDPAAQLMGRDGGQHADYRVGGVFDQAQMPAGFEFAIAAASDTPCSTLTQGYAPNYAGGIFVSGTGTWRIEGRGPRWGRLTAPSSLWRDLDQDGDGTYETIKRDGATLVAFPLGAANQEVQIICKICDWRRSSNEFMPEPPAYEGAGLFIATPDYQNFFSTAGIDMPDTDPYGGGIPVQAYWSMPSINNRGSWGSSENLEGNPVGNGSDPGMLPVWLGIRRSVDNRIYCSYSRVSENDLSDFYASPAGFIDNSSLESSYPVVVGVYINEGLIINLDYIITTWFPATNETGSQVLGMACDHTPRTYPLVWDAADLLPFANWGGPVQAQLSLRAADLDGPGQYTNSAWDSFISLTPFPTRTPLPTRTPNTTATPPTPAITPTLSFTPTEDVELIQDGGFEQAFPNVASYAHTLRYWDSYNEVERLPVNPVRFSDGIDAALEGDWSIGGVHTWYGGVYQTVPVNQGALYHISAWARTVRQNSDMRLGVDPTGGWNHFSENVNWTPWASHDDDALAPPFNYEEVSMDIQAQATQITVFLEYMKRVSGGSSASWDKVSVLGPDPGAPRPTIIPLPTVPAIEPAFFDLEGLWVGGAEMIYPDGWAPWYLYNVPVPGSTSFFGNKTRMGKNGSDVAHTGQSCQSIEQTGGYGFLDAGLLTRFLVTPGHQYRAGAWFHIDSPTTCSGSINQNYVNLGLANVDFAPDLSGNLALVPSATQIWSHFQWTTGVHIPGGDLNSQGPIQVYDTWFQVSSPLVLATSTTMSLAVETLSLSDHCTNTLIDSIVIEDLPPGTTVTPSPTLFVPTNTPLPHEAWQDCDHNGDGYVDAQDLLLFQTYWHNGTPRP